MYFFYLKPRAVARGFFLPRALRARGSLIYGAKPAVNRWLGPGL